MTMEKVCLWDKEERLIGSVEMDIRDNNEISFRFDVSQMQEYPIKELMDRFRDSLITSQYSPNDYDFEPTSYGYKVTSSFAISREDLLSMVDDSFHPDFSDYGSDWYAECIACGQTDLREDFRDMPDELKELLGIWKDWYLKVAPEEVIHRAVELFDSLPEITPEKVWRDLGIGVSLQDVLNELGDDQLKELSSHIGWRGQEAYICVDGYIGYRDRGWWGNFEDQLPID